MAKTDFKYEVEATIAEDGTIRPLHFAMYKRLFRNLMDKELLVTVQPLRRRRSDRQNRYYWGVMIPTIRAFHKESTGESITPDEVHAYNLCTVLGQKPVIKEIMGVEVVSFEQKRTSDMDTKDFTEFVDVLMHYWAERGCVIPVPRGENLLTDHLLDE